MPFFYKKPKIRIHSASAPQMRKLLRKWYQTLPGLYLFRTEQRLLRNIIPDLFGYHLLQAGVSFSTKCLKSSRIANHIILDIDLCKAHVRKNVQLEDYDKCIQGNPENLPVASDSIDVLLLPHILEFSSNPHAVLREADRILIAEGHLIIMGFNPRGIWLLWRLVLFWRGNPPWCGRFISSARLGDWLELLGFDVKHQQYYFFRPPFRNPRIMRKLQFLEKIGARWLSILGGAYIVVAQKRVATLTPIKPRWRPNRRPVVAPGLAGNSSVSSENK